MPQRQALLQNSLVAGIYEKAIDRESAYEMLQARTAQTQPANGKGSPAPASDGGLLGGLSDVLFGSTGPRGGQRDGLAQTMAKSAVRTMGTSLGREILRGVLGSIFGGRKR